MTHYLYKMPGGMPDLSSVKLNLQHFPGYVFIGAFDSPPDVQAKIFDANNQLVDAHQEAAYVRNRRNAYPSFADQLDALWHGMNDGTLPKVEPFYTDIKTVKDAHPKQ